MIELGKSLHYAVNLLTSLDPWSVAILRAFLLFRTRELGGISYLRAGSRHSHAIHAMRRGIKGSCKVLLFLDVEFNDKTDRQSRRETGSFSQCTWGEWP